MKVVLSSKKALACTCHTLVKRGLEIIASGVAVTRREIELVGALNEVRLEGLRF